MNLLYEKMKLLGRSLRGDGGGGGSGGDGSDSASAPSMGVDSADTGQTVTMSGELPTVTATAEAEPNDSGTAGLFGGNSALNSLFNNIVSKNTMIPGGAANAALSAIFQGNQSTANQGMAINSVIGLAPIIGQINSLAGLLGMPTIGSVVSGMGGVPASSVPGDPSGGGSGTGTGAASSSSASSPSATSLGGLYGGSSGSLGSNQGLGSMWNNSAVQPVVGNDVLSKLLSS